MPTPTRLLTPLLIVLAAACGAPPPVAMSPAPRLSAAVAAVRHDDSLPTPRAASASETMLASSAAKSAAAAGQGASLAAKATAELSPPPVRPALLTRCDAERAIVVYKAARQLELRCGDEVAARYGISLGFEPVGDKQREGDGRTPEGEYLITGKFSSQFHRSLQIAYPNAADAARGLADKQISGRQHAAIVNALNSCRRPPQNTSLGSLLQVHGGGGGPQYSDWTLGCVAVDNDAIEAAYAFHVPGCADGKPRTPLRILP